MTMEKEQRRLKEATSMRLSPEAKRLIAQLAVHLGLPKAAVMEQAVRVLARREGVAISDAVNGAACGPAEKSLSERLAALAEEVPDEEFADRPTDFATQHDHYIYGTAKRG
jgi:hypothetical protein